MNTKSKTTPYIIYSIAAAALLLTAQISLAGSATWLLSPQDSAWENANNWTPGGPPNGPSDIATFAQSSQTGVNISTSEEVNSIVFASDSVSYVFSIGACNGVSCEGQLIISGTGVNNNSSVGQNFQTTNLDQIIFNNASTAASAQMSILNGGGFLAEVPTGYTIFNDSSSAGGASIANASYELAFGGDISRTIFNGASTADHASISNHGAAESHGAGGQTIFNDTSTAANASIDNLGSGPASIAGRALTTFNDASSAGHATITNQTGDYAGATIFTGSSTADGAILIANGGAIVGGAILFNGASTGGTARIRVFDNGYLDISGHQSGVTIGSIYGSGNVLLGPNNLTVGTNGNNTAFSGVISNDRQGGSLAKVGSGILTLQANDCIADTVGLILVSGSIIKLDFTGPPDTIAFLVVNGVPQPPGIYGGPMSGAPNILPEFGGLGTVEVGIVGPSITTDAASDETSSSATLNGSVNPHALTTSVHFQYGTTTSYGSSTASRSYTGYVTQDATANISGLNPNTTYHLRLVGTNSGGTTYGHDRTFTTPSATGPPIVTSNSPTNVGSNSATVHGTVYPHGLTTTVYFQYGTTTSYGSTTSLQTKTGNTYQSVSASISGLTENTTYHFRIVATNTAGTRYGSDMTFSTLSATGPPVVITNPASFIASYSAMLNGTVDPHGLTTTLYFQYGTTTSYGLTTAPQSRSGNAYRHISANISGLTASTTYHFRIVATNSAGTTYGADRTFTTLSATGPPVAITNPATNVATSSATLNGSVDPHGLTTTVYFQYGTTTSYGNTTANQTKTGNTYQNLTANVSGLAASTTYHFRIVATNSSGTRYGSDRPFTTTP